MKPTVKVELSDYLAISKMVYDNRPSEPTTFEVEFKSGGRSLYLCLMYEYDYREARGGSFGGYDFERLSEVTSESFDMVYYECLDADGEPINTDFVPSKLLDILN